ncbi:unnamed protein product [Sphagnum jensenii]|uniref:Myb/SANT-like DNA-binding domain-containing protein n=1 Tax=Sphagnum jensenii TaxID=128206 RepID=A0ABP0W981_9BRYO
MVEDLCINTLLVVAMEEAMASIGASDDQVSPFSTQQQYPEPHIIAPATEEQQQQQQEQKKKKTSSSKRHRTADVDDAPREANRREYYEWSHGAVHSLLDIYEEKYLALQRGNLRGRHWHEVALHVSARQDGSKSAKTSKQCKMKIENLKRRYKMEKTHRVGDPVSAGSNCCWPYYDRLDSMLGFTPKSNAGTQKECGDTLSNSDPLLSHDVNLKLKARLSTDPTTEFQGESEMPSGIGKYEERDVSADGGEGNPEQLPETAPVHHKDSKTDASEVNTMLNLPGTSGVKQQSKPPVQSPLTNPGVLLANSITAFAEVLVRIEQAKMELHKDLERQRTEADLRRTEMVLQNQLEIAKLFANSQKRKARSPSLSESE